MRARAETTRREGMAGVLESTLDRWFMPDTRARRPNVIDCVKKTIMRDDPEVHAAMWDMISGFDVITEIGRVGRPTLILVGENDPSCPPEASRALHDQIKGSRLHVLPRTSHMSILEAPGLVNPLLAAFIAHVSSS